MKAPRRARAWLCVLTLLPGAMCIAGDPRGVTYSDYVMAGIALDDPAAGLVALERRVAVSDHFTVSASLAYLHVRDTFEELQLRMIATGTVTRRDWTLEDRQLISVGEDSSARYRNRLRVMRAGLFARKHLSVRAFDELYVDLDSVAVLRNDLAFGIGVQLNGRCSAELYHVWVEGRQAFRTNYALVLFMLKLD